MAHIGSHQDVKSKQNHYYVHQKDLFVVRVYDGFDNQWMDACQPVCREEADRIWNEKTKNGTKNTKFADIDYYKVFPAHTRMVFTDGFGEI